MRPAEFGAQSLPVNLDRFAKGLWLEGVIDVKSNLAKRETTVVFDDTRIKVDALTKATTEAGFPSTVAPNKP